MATKEEGNVLQTLQEHTEICERHEMTIDLTCDDCEEFLCSECIKEGHRDHDWKTISTAATLKIRGLFQSMLKIEKEDIQLLDEKIHKLSTEMENNKILCETEVLNLKIHCDKIVDKVDEIKEQEVQRMKDNLNSKNTEVRNALSRLEFRKKNILMLVQTLKENKNMSDFNMLKMYWKLSRDVCSKDDDYERLFYSLQHETGDINENQLEMMIGGAIDTNDITVTEVYSFQWTDKPIGALHAIDSKTCLMQNNEESYCQVNKKGVTKIQFEASFNERNVPKIHDDQLLAIVPDSQKKSVNFLSESGLVYFGFSTDPMEIVGVCLTDISLLVTLKDTDSDLYQLNTLSRRLVRYIVRRSNVIKDFEYQEDGRTRLFTLPWRLIQNGTSDNADICVVNLTSSSTGEIVILSYSGSLKSVYRGHSEREQFYPTDVVCDPQFNIIVNNVLNSNVYLLNPNGKFLRYLLKEDQVNQPMAMSLNVSRWLTDSTFLWIGDKQGLVKVYEYSPPDLEERKSSSVNVCPLL